jgi:acyl-CoA reductase-like NAD-dependent aldehyde dehydrogenase
VSAAQPATGYDLVERPGVARARMLLQRARWAAAAFSSYDPQRVRHIVESVAEVAYQNAQRYAEWAVRETGMGVVEHKRVKNELCSRGLLEAYGGQDYASARVDEDRRVLELPRPAGVVFALVPSTNPVATVYFKVLACLLTRNAVVVSPHPLARECSVDAARLLADAAVAAGAPDGCVQVVDEPSIPLIEALMCDPMTNLIVATGGVAVVRAAYRSGNPAIGVGPGNVPSLVDGTADVAHAASAILESKTFDNSVLCTAESSAIVEERVADAFAAELRRHGAYGCEGEEVDRVRDAVFPDGRLRLDLIGKDAAALASAAQLRVPPRTRLLVAPVPLVVPEEPLAGEKLLPLLGLVRVPDARRGIAAACAVLRIAGAGHTAAIHSRDAATIMAYGAAVRVLRVVVNVGSSTGAAGFGTGLAPSMTIGTGFFGRSSLGENLEPRHLVNWTRVALSTDPSEPVPSFAGLEPWEAAPAAGGAPPAAADGADAGSLRDEVRRLVLEELRELVRR